MITELSGNFWRTASRDDQRDLAGLLQHLESLSPAARFQTLKALRLKHAGQGAANAGFVVDNETTGAAGHDRLRTLGGVWHCGYDHWWDDGCHEHPIGPSL
jgi:hypothetical protein